MNILTFWKSLLPSLSQDGILDDIAAQRDKVSSNLLPSLENLSRYFEKAPFYSNISLTFEEAVARLSGDRHGKIFDILHDHFKTLPKLLDGIEKMVEDTFSQDLPKEALTFRKANVLRLLELISFVISYTTRICLRIIEAEVQSSKNNSADAELSSREKAFFEDYQEAWLSGLGVLFKPVKDILAGLETSPDVTIDENSVQFVETQTKATDPLNLNFISPDWNPIYRIRLIKSEWDVSSLNQAKEERKLVELRLLNLKQRRLEKTDPQLEKAIEVSQDRLTKLDFKIDKLSGKAG